MPQIPGGPTHQWSGEPQTPHRGDGKQSTLRRYLWPILAGVFALVAVLLSGVIIGRRNNAAGPPPATTNVQATAAATTRHRRDNGQSGTTTRDSRSKHRHSPKRQILRRLETLMPV